MDMTTLKHGTGSPIRKKLRISQRVPQRGLGTTELKPELTYFAVQK
jgi:hypothetical protein